jgi:hypothetical protein
MKRYISIFQEFIGWKWFSAFLFIPTIIFIWDINIQYFWLILYYISYLFIVVTGFIKFAKDKS